MEKRAIVIVGPTCSGKTNLSINIAKKLSTEIISADSRQIYKLLNIGTAKPTEHELNSVKHHLIDLIFPDQDYDVSKFENDALQIIIIIHANTKIPIIVGGSGLYVKALVEGIFNEVDRDEEYREELKRKRAQFGNEFLYNELEKIDPVSASKMLPQNWKRVMRALEVYHITGQPIWKLQSEHKREINIKFFQFGLEWNRAVLYKRIEQRVDEMINKGLVNEVDSLLLKGYSKNLNSLNTVGYKEIISYLEGNITLERAVELIKRNTRRYAKRQLTWFRKSKDIHWIQCNERTGTEDLISAILKKVLAS